MDRNTQGRHRGETLLPTDFRLLAQPLQFIAEDHLREREMCARLDHIAAQGTGSAEEIASVLRFLRHELPWHLEDEEIDLFPMLSKRCHPEDEIDKVIARLTSDHAHADTDTPLVIAILDAQRQSGALLTAAQRHALTDYASHARRHLILENAIILPLARARLSRKDLNRMSARMARRRQYDPDAEHSDAE